MMRMPIIALFVVAAALLGETQISNAQSPERCPRSVGMTVRDGPESAK